MRWRQSLDPAGFVSQDRIIRQLGNQAGCHREESAASLRRGGGGRMWAELAEVPAEGVGPREGGKSRKLRPDLRVVMSAGGAVEPGLPAAAAAPSPAPARDPGPGHLFRPISAEDEEQQPTEIESLCRNCYRNVRRGCGRWRLEGWAEAGRSGGRRSCQAGPTGDLEARHAWGSVDGRLGVSLVLSLTVFCFLRA